MIHYNRLDWLLNCLILSVNIRLDKEREIFKDKLRLLKYLLDVGKFNQKSLYVYSITKEILTIIIIIAIVVVVVSTTTS